MDEIVPHVLTFVNNNIKLINWPYWITTPMVFGSILSSFEVNILEPLAEQTIFMLIEPSSRKNDWALGKIFEVSRGKFLV